MRDAKRYLPALDGLRALSILLVWFSHAWLGNVVPGGLGVTIFFFISGFIITRLMLKETEAGDRLDIRAFYVRRLLRLMPALFVFVFICVLVLWRVDGKVPWLDVGAAFFYYSNYWNICGCFADGALWSPLSITWSLAVEEHYYFVFPILFAALVHRGPWLGRTIVLLLVAVLAWRIGLAATQGLDALGSKRLYMGTDTRLDSILYGAGFCLLTSARPRLRAWLGRVDVFAVGVLLLLATLVYRDAFFRETIRYSVQGVALGFTFQYLVFGSGWPTRLLSTRPMTYLGQISYSLYLYHWLAFVLVDAYLHDMPLWVRMGAMAALSWSAAHLSWRYVERIGNRLRSMLL